MDKAIQRQRLGWAASALWMGLIFLFSAQDGTESGITSEWVMELLHGLFDTLLPDGAESDMATGWGMFLLRKGAHFFVFTVLGSLFCTTICQYTGATPLQKVGLPLVLGILYACTDELHQYFIPGRACQIRDVCIDTGGVLCGILLTMGIRWLIRRSRQKRAMKNK